MISYLMPELVVRWIIAQDSASLNVLIILAVAPSEAITDSSSGVVRLLIHAEKVLHTSHSVQAVLSVSGCNTGVRAPV